MHCTALKQNNFSLHSPPRSFSIGHPSLPKAAEIQPITSYSGWYPWKLIISIMWWYPYGVISPLSFHIHLYKPLNTLFWLVWSNFSDEPEQSGPRHHLGTRGGSWGTHRSWVSLIKANQIQPVLKEMTPRKCITPWYTHAHINMCRLM